MPRIFVGIPTYNRPHLVREAIDSVRVQSFTDFRAVISDNCSSPEVAAAVGQYVASLRDDRFAFHRQIVNQGEYGQGRLFMAGSAGEDFLVMLHDDDILLPGYFAAGVGALDAQPRAELFAANFYMMDQGARRLEEMTAWRRRHLGRDGVPEGLFDVRASHVMTGFTPITGTLFRRSALERSGFADPHRIGNYPFECDIFLRLGDIGAKGWFDPRELVGIRDHAASLKHNLNLMDNPHVVGPMLEMFRRRRYAGALERRRRVMVSRLARADALIRLRRADIGGFRRMLRLALRENPLSPRAWALTVMGLISPDALRRGLPPVQTIQDVGETAPPDHGPARMLVAE